MWIVFLWLVFSVVAGIIAGSKNRSGIGYFLISIVLSPIVGLLLAAFLPVIVEAPKTVVEVDPVETHTKCPECRELVLIDARKCKHCGAALTPTTPPTEEEIMAQHGITKNGAIYHVKEWRYDKLSDAVAQAKRMA